MDAFYHMYVSYACIIYICIICAHHIYDNNTSNIIILTLILAVTILAQYVDGPGPMLLGTSHGIVLLYDHEDKFLQIGNKVLIIGYPAFCNTTKTTLFLIAEFPKRGIHPAYGQWCHRAAVRAVAR